MIYCIDEDNIYDDAKNQLLNYLNLYCYCSDICYQNEENKIIHLIHVMIIASMIKHINMNLM